MNSGRAVRKAVSEAVALIVAFLVCFNSCFDTVIFAAEIDDIAVEIEEEVEEAVSADIDGLTNDELLAGYLNELMYGCDDADASIQKVDAGYNSLNKYEKKIYEALKLKITEIAAGERASSEIALTIRPEGGGVKADVYLEQTKFTFTELGVSNKEDAKAAIVEKYDINVTRIHKALLYDCPYELYWHDKVVGCKFARSYGYDDLDNPTYINITKLTVKMCTAEEYADTSVIPTDQYLVGVDTKMTQAAGKAVNEAGKVVADNASLGDYEKLCAYRDYICDNVDYNKTAEENEYYPYGNPWQIIWVFDGDPDTNIVCEGYSKAFKYLCDLSDFESENIHCFLVDGYSRTGVKEPERHMWNIISMDDSQNYLVDLTNVDSIVDKGYVFLNGYTFKGTSNLGDSLVGEVDETYYRYKKEYGVLYYYNNKVVNQILGDAITNLSQYDYDKRIKRVEIKGPCVYTGNEIVPDIEVYTYDGTVIAEEKYDTELVNNIEACDSSVENAPRITVTGKDEYIGEISVPFTIAPVNIEDDGFEIEIEEYIDTPEGCEPVCKVTWQDRVLLTTDYNVAIYEADLDGNPSREVTGKIKKSGDYVFVATGTGNFVGSRQSKVCHIDVDVKGVDEGDVPESGTIPENIWISGLKESYVYTGTAIRPQIRVYDNNTALVQGKDYQLIYTSNINAGTASITVKGIGNYTSFIKRTFDIEQLSIEGDEFVADEISIAATGRALKPSSVLMRGTKKLVAIRDYSVKYCVADSEWNPVGDETDTVETPGNYLMCYSGNGNYTGKKYIHLYVADELVPMSKVIALKIAAQPYNAEGVTPKVTLKYGKTTLTEDEDYRVVYYNNKAVGSAYIIATGLGKYTGTKKIPFTVTGTPLNRAVISGLPVSCTYSGIAKTFEPELYIRETAKTARINLTEGIDYKISYANNLNTGAATVTFIGINGYIGSVRRVVRILPENVSEDSANVSVRLRSSECVYSKNGVKPSVTVRYTDEKKRERILTEGIDYTLSYKYNRAVDNRGNSPAVVVRFKKNLKGVIEKKFVIVKKDLSRVKLELADKVYNGRKGIYATSVLLRDEDGMPLAANRDFVAKYVYSYYEDTTVTNNGETVVRSAGTVIEGDCLKDIILAETVIAVTVNAKEGGNYYGSVTGTYRIASKAINTAVVVAQSRGYTGKPITLTGEMLTVKCGKDTLTEGIDYEIIEGSYVNNVKKGRGRVTIRGLGNYCGIKVVTFGIVARKME